MYTESPEIDYKWIYSLILSEKWGTITQSHVCLNDINLKVIALFFSKFDGLIFIKLDFNHFINLFLSDSNTFYYKIS